MKWPGLFSLIARIIAFPFAVLLGFVGLVYTMVDEGLDWWAKQMERRK